MRASASARLGIQGRERQQLQRVRPLGTSPRHRHHLQPTAATEIAGLGVLSW